MYYLWSNVYVFDGNTIDRGDIGMATQKMQMRKLAEIGAYLLRWYAAESTTDKTVLKFTDVDTNIKRMLSEDQLEFEFEVRGNDEKVAIK